MRCWLIAAMLAGCNSILGIHEIEVDAAGDGDPCTGTCECREDVDCSGAHAVCIDEILSRTCGCAAGYTKLSGACTWTGVIGDAAFQQADQWKPGPNIVLDPLAPLATGMIDTGLARAISPCGITTELTQPVLMPRLSRAEPLVLEFTLNSVSFGDAPYRNGVRIGDIWIENLLSGFGWRSLKLCLGDGQFAPESTKGRGTFLPVAITPAPMTQGFCSGEQDFDHFSIVPAAPGQCPMPGTALDGDANGTMGWTFGTDVGYDATIGENDARGIKLAPKTRCEQTTASTLVSVPSTTAAGTAEFSFMHYKSIAGAQLSATLDSNALTLNVGTTKQIEHYCVPAYMRGGVFQFGASFQPAAPTGTQTCNDVVSPVAGVDSVHVALTPACGNDPAIADPGFESGYSLLDTVVSGGTAQTVAGSTNRHLELAITAQCQSAYWYAHVITPAVSPGTGPALTFTYLLPASGPATFTVSPSQGFTVMRGGSTPVKGTICLDKTRTGRDQEVRFGLDLSGGLCGATAADNVEIDDLKVTADPACN